VAPVCTERGWASAPQLQPLLAPHARAGRLVGSDRPAPLPHAPPPAGNPVSSFVCFNLVVVPALRRMSGWDQPLLRRVHATLTSDLKLDPERPEYHRVTLQYSRYARSVVARAGLQHRPQLTRTLASA
jgi:hypothetical protein